VAIPIPSTSFVENDRHVPFDPVAVGGRAEGRVLDGRCAGASGSESAPVGDVTRP
jgi:hypothetical protein